MDDWIDYYDSTHTIYASKLHRDLHFQLIASDIIGYISSPDAVVLDYACGEALSAAQVADACGKLYLAEPAPGVRGRLVVGDILRPEVGMGRDVIALLRFAARHGFLRDALIGLVSTALSDYRQLRSKVGLQRYSEAEMIAKLAAAGFTASRAPFNIGYNPWRMTFVARHALSLPPAG